MRTFSFCGSNYIERFTEITPCGVQTPSLGAKERYAIDLVVRL